MSLPLSVHERLPRRYPLSRGFKRYGMYFSDGAHVDVSLAHPTRFAEGCFFKRLGRGGGNLPRLFSWQPTVWGAEFAIGNLLYTDRLAFYIQWDDGTSTGWIDVADIVDGIWYFAFLIYDGVNVMVYLNRDKVYESDAWAGKTPNPVTYVRIGDAVGEYIDGIVALAYVYGPELFDWLTVNGKSIDWFVRYNMLNYHNPVRNGLLLWLHDRVTADTWYDESGYGNDGTVYGAVRENLAMWELRAEVEL